MNAKNILKIYILIVWRQMHLGKAYLKAQIYQDTKCSAKRLNLYMAQILNRSSRSGRKKRQTNFIQIKQHSRNGGTSPPSAGTAPPAPMMAGRDK